MTKIMEEQKLMSDAKYKQFIAAVDKCLKSFEYSSEWADLISCLGKLNKIIVTYKQYAAVPRKLLIGKRLAQCLHPALPSGVHLKALESYDLILTQIGAGRLAQDLFIYTSGLFPLLSEASMAVKPVVLDIYENHFLPLGKKLYPSLSGLLLGLLPGIEEVSEYTERTIGMLDKLCECTDEPIFFSCLWDGVLHSSQVRLQAITFVIGYMAKKPGETKLSVMGADVNLMVNAICASFDDSNVLVQRITLDFAISFISFHSTTLPQPLIVKLLTYALAVLLRRDMSLNRRVFQWLLNVNSEGNPIAVLDQSSGPEEKSNEETQHSYFDTYSKQPLTAALVILFQDVVKKVDDDPQTYGTPKQRSLHLKPFRILITLLDKPEVGSAILDQVMIEVFRTLYKYSIIKKKLVEINSRMGKDISTINEELIRNANLLFNSFEPFYMWDYCCQMLHTCSFENEEKQTMKLSLLADVKTPTYDEMFKIISHLLDVVLLEISTETQSEHWPKLLKQTIVEMINHVAEMPLGTVLEGINLISKLLSRLSPNLVADITAQEVVLSSSVLDQKSPPTSPGVQVLETFSFGNDHSYSNSKLILDCVELSKSLFAKFVEQRILKRSPNLLLVFQQKHGLFSSVEIPNSSELSDLPVKDDSYIQGFRTFCRYLVQLSCFPLCKGTFQPSQNDVLPDWLQVLITCCLHGNCFDMQGTAIGTLLDLIDVILTVEHCKQKTRESFTRIDPLISSTDLKWIERSNLYMVLANNLWHRLTPRTCQWHQGSVDLFLHLHNVTPKASICEEIISNSLVHSELDVKELSHWRFSQLWHLSREFYKDDKNKSTIAIRTIDKCMLLMIDSVQSPHTTIKDCAEQWLSHSVHFGDIGRILESILLLLLHPTSARVAIHYSKQWRENNEKILSKTIKADGSLLEEELDTLDEVLQQSSETEPTKTDATGEICADDKRDPERKHPEKLKVCTEVKAVPTHPLLIHKLLYTQRYDTQQCFYTMKRILMILKAEGRAFICAAATTSMNVCNTPHQSMLRQLLIRHRRVISGKDFYGSLAESHQLLVRASTAKYLEILFSVCLYFIRSVYHESLEVSSHDKEGNFAVQSASAEVLTEVLNHLLFIARDSGKGFSTYINDLLARSKVQRIALHCLLSTVYAITGDYRESKDKGYYSMVSNPNLAETTPRANNTRSLLDLQRSVLKFVESIIHLEFCIGTENVATLGNEKKSRRDKNNLINIPPFEYAQYKPVVSQPMFISAILAVLKEKRWIHLHGNWIKLLTACLPKLSNDMAKIVVPVVAQLCENLKFVTNLYRESYSSKRDADCEVEIPPDYMLSLLDGITSFCHYILISKSSSVSVVSGARPGSRKNMSDDPSSSLFSNLVNAFSVSSPPAATKATNNESDIKAFNETRDGLLGILPVLLTSIVYIWKVWDINKIGGPGPMLISRMPLAIGSPKSVRLSILQLITPLAMNHTLIFLTSVADVWGVSRDNFHGKPSATLKCKEWLSVVNKKFLPDPSEDQKALLDIVNAIKALSLEVVIDTSKQVLKQVVSLKDRPANAPPLDVCLLQFLHELLLNTTTEDVVQIKTSLVNLLKESMQLHLHPPALFVLFAILTIHVHRVPVPTDRRSRKELQDLAQKFVENLNSIAASSLEGSAWFRRSLQVVTQLEHSSDLEDSSVSDRSSTQDAHASPGGTKNCQYSVPAILLMAEYLVPMLDMLYLSEEKDKIASSLVYLMYNVVPYLRNHSTQNTAGFRACSALLAAVSDYQYTLRAWRKDVYDLFIDTDFFQMDTISFGFWKTTIDRLITYDSTVFKDLMQKIALSQSGAINIFANREQEMEQRAQLLKRLSFAIFCGEFDQYHQYLPDIQERLAESIRQLQGPFLHEQVFLCFRVLLTRISPNHLISLWPPMLTELVLVFVNMEHELTNAGKSKSKTKVQVLESFMGTNGYFKDPNKWLRLYLAVCKLLDYLLVLPSSVLPHYQVYKWAFSETPGVYYASEFPIIDEMITSSSQRTSRMDATEKKPRNGVRRVQSKDEEVSKMSLLTSPISEQNKQQEKIQSKKKESSRQEGVASLFAPYISRILKILRKRNLPKENWKTPVRVPGQLIVLNSKINNIYELLPFFLGVTGDLAATDVDVEKLTSFKMSDVEGLIEKDFMENPSVS